MQWYEAEVRELERSATREAVPESPVVFYGSSSIRLWDTMALDLRAGNVVNRGFGGSTLEACVYFFERLVLPAQPASVVIYAGDNDLGDGRSAEQVYGYFLLLLDKLERTLAGKPIGFISIKPSPSRFAIADKIRRVNAHIEADLERREKAYFIDVYPAMLGPNGRPDKRFFTEDGLHMSHAGYLAWAEVLERYRKQLFIHQTQESNTPCVHSEQCESGISQMVQPPAKP